MYTKPNTYTGKNNLNFIDIILPVQCKYGGSWREEICPFKWLYVVPLLSKFEFMDMANILNFDI